ncbi:AAA-domain-containing protein [Mycena chlorophos]|uniref:vesicle-fusing ATPase n=1 Tax=Mycena chlorophos TaxID=658473 RepID=A0A8H6WHZ8_MYCCL|nr:AAA-domain-containing protein [Mycena chlorophos]
MSSQTNLNKAISIVNKAIEHDKAQNHAQACKDYMDALDYFMLALKYEKNDQFKILIRSKIDDYLARAEVLKKTLTPPTPTASAALAVKRTDAADDPDTKKLRAGLAEAIISTSGSTSSSVTWDDIAGLAGAKQALKEAVIIPHMFPHLFTGKRRAAVAGEAKSTFFSISSTDIVSKWQGESEKLVRHLFEMAREMRPSVIFIDEVDSLTTARGDGDSEASRRLKTEFLVQMDGLGRDDTGVLVIGATNIPWAIDLSIKRRFERRIYIPLPDVSARETILKLHVGDTPSELTDADYRALAERLEGYSGADVSSIVQDALMQPIRKLMSATHFKPVERSMLEGAASQWTACDANDQGAVKKALVEMNPEEVLDPRLVMKDFESALENVRPTVKESDLKGHLEWTKEFGSYGS